MRRREPVWKEWIYYLCCRSGYVFILKIINRKYWWHKYTLDAHTHTYWLTRKIFACRQRTLLFSGYFVIIAFCNLNLCHVCVCVSSAYYANYKYAHTRATYIVYKYMRTNKHYHFQFGVRHSVWTHECIVRALPAMQPPMFIRLSPIFLYNFDIYFR